MEEGVVGEKSLKIFVGGYNALVSRPMALETFFVTQIYLFNFLIFHILASMS